MSKKFKLELTGKEMSVVSKILEEVECRMYWESEDKEYHIDHESTIVCLDKGEMQSLKSAVKKI